MRIVVFSASFGRGYRQAAATLADRLRAQAGPSAIVDVVDHLEHFAPKLQVLARLAYQQSERFFPSCAGDFSDLVRRYPDDPVVRELAAFGVEGTAGYLAEKGPDAVVSAHPVPGAVAAEALRVHLGDERTVCATVITDLAVRSQWIHPGADMVCVAGPEVKDGLVAQGTPWGLLHVTGAPIGDGFGRREERPALRARLGLGERFTALLLGEGMAPAEADDVCRRLGGLGVQVVAVAAQDRRLSERFDSAAARMSNVRAYAWTDEMPVLMSAADVLVGRAGGMTMPEALAAGLPQVFVGGVPAQEVPNVDHLLDWGVALLARDEADAARRVDFLAHHPDRLRGMADQARRLGRPDATRVIVDLVMGYVRRRADA